MDTVLIVDDERAIRSLLSHWVEGSGYLVAEAASAEEALARMDECGAVVAICDVQMPIHDGFWFARELRRLFPETALIMTTGGSERGDLLQQTGAIDFLMKPFNRAYLRAGLKRAIEWSHEQAKRKRAQCSLHCAPTHSA